jgi:hypothetical protein
VAFISRANQVTAVTQMSGKPSMHPARNESVDTDTPRIARIF